MLLNELHLEQVKQDREREIRERSRERIRARRSAASRLGSRRVRRVIGRSIVEIGHRIAAEPQPRLARSR